MNLFGHHLAGLFDFSGRENRQPFWLWALIVYAVQFAASMIVMTIMMGGMFGGMASLAGRGQDYIDQHPEIAQQVMMQAMAPLMRNMMVFSAAMAIASAVLLGAAVTRRLHDGDRSGWWSAPVFALHIGMPLAYMSVLPRFFETFGKLGAEMPPDQAHAAMLPMMQTIMPLWLLGMIGFVAMIVLIVFLAMPGTSGPNRYGDDPLAIR